MFLSTILPAIFLLIGIGLLIGAGFSIRNTRKFLEKAILTSGSVVEMLKTSSHGNNGRRTMYRPVLEFHTRTGEQVRFESMISSNPPAYKVGDTVEILYDPEPPHPARIKSFVSLWLLAAILGGMGAIFSLIGLALLLGFIPV